MKIRNLFLSLAVGTSLLAGIRAAGQTITVRDTVYTTYPYSDPDPAPFGGRIYPYFRYDGYSAKSTREHWQEVILENEFLRVRILPALGGKVWSVYDKVAGNEMFYDNDAVKFRDIALRGPWTSGGIEFNYGIIGHAPSCSSPVDWKTVKKDDGTVSCYIGVLDLLTRTHWTVEISLPAGKDWLLTRTFWHNSTGKFQPYYTWTTAGLGTSEDLRLIYPSSYSVSHHGTIDPYPIDPYGNDMRVYAQQVTPGAKSFHPAGSHKGFFGAWWKGNDNGMMHLADRDQKLGRKYFCWAPGDEGKMWEELLTDNLPQYVELQAGRLFNQNDNDSNFTPYRQFFFTPFGTDEYSEYWIPFSGTKGVGDVTLQCVANVVEEEGGWSLHIYPLQRMRGLLCALDAEGKEISSWNVDLGPAELLERNVGFAPSKLTLDGKTLWTLDQEILDRPNSLPEGYDHNSASGSFLLGSSYAGQRDYSIAEKYADRALEADPNYVQALDLKAMLLLNKGDWQGAFDYGNRALSIDQYDARANYISGLAAVELGKKADALDRFEIAAITSELRSAAQVQLSRIHFVSGELEKAMGYAERSIRGNMLNVTGIEMGYLCAREAGEAGKMQLDLYLKEIEAMDPLCHFPDFARFLSGEIPAEELSSGIRQEMKVQEYIENALFFESLGLRDDAVRILQACPGRNALTDLWIAYLKEDKAMIPSAERAGLDFVFPFRTESLKPLSWAVENGGGWQSRYLLSALLSSLGRSREAFDLIKDIEDCGYAPFHILRSRIGGGLEDMKKAVAEDPSQWRYGRDVAETLLRQGDASGAAKAIAPYYLRDKENFHAGYLYAEALAADAKWAEADKVLKDIVILPYEGQGNSHRLYRRVKLRLAALALDAGKVSRASRFVEESRLWPHNLGVGRPVDANEDAENWMAAVIAARKGDKAAAGTLLGKIQEGKAVWQEAFNEAASGKKVSACSILDKYDLGI